jgi:hypothetical protein
VPLEGGQPVTPTNEWINIYCEQVFFDGSRFPRGAIIAAYDPDGVLCGIDRFRTDGSFGFMPIYRDDEYTDYDEGAEPGDLIVFTVNGMTVDTDPLVYWTGNGDVFEVCRFNSERCRTIELHAGWNLISWNVAYTGNIEAAIADIKECVDLVMSYERGGLTYDPELPGFSTLKEVDFLHGYWFRMNCDATLEVCGPGIPQDQFIRMETGWNLVAYWPGQILPVEEGFGSILDHLTVAAGFEDGGLIWVPGMGPFNTLQ